MLLNKSLNFNFLRSEKQNGAVKSRPLSKYFVLMYLVRHTIIFSFFIISICFKDRALQVKVKGKKKKKNQQPFLRKLLCLRRPENEVKAMHNSRYE